MNRIVAGQESSPSPNGPLRSIWLVLILIMAVIVGAAAGLIAFVNGAPGAAAVFTGAGTFGGMVMLLLALLNFALGKST